MRRAGAEITGLNFTRSIFLEERRLHRANRSGRVPLPLARASELQHLFRREELQGDRSHRGKLSEFFFHPSKGDVALSLLLSPPSSRGHPCINSCRGE